MDYSRNIRRHKLFPNETIPNVKIPNVKIPNPSLVLSPSPSFTEKFGNIKFGPKNSGMLHSGFLPFSGFGIFTFGIFTFGIVSFGKSLWRRIKTNFTQIKNLACIFPHQFSQYCIAFFFIIVAEAGEPFYYRL